MFVRPLFQFQFGSIKSDDIIESAPGVPIFQFQFGSIKRK